jgi:hypothetical protein
MVIYFAKNGSPTYMHTFVLFILLLVTFIYSVTWAVQFKSEVITTSKDGTVPLMNDVYISDEEEDMISLHYLSRFKESYLPPYALESYPQLRHQVEQEASEVQKDELSESQSQDNSVDNGKEDDSRQQQQEILLDIQ